MKNQKLKKEKNERKATQPCLLLAAVQAYTYGEVLRKHILISFRFKQKY
jgi:hypothetical protein